jgi:hypothetical protein
VAERSTHQGLQHQEAYLLLLLLLLEGAWRALAPAHALALLLLLLLEHHVVAAHLLLLAAHRPCHAAATAAAGRPPLLLPLLHVLLPSPQVVASSPWAPSCPLALHGPLLLPSSWLALLLPSGAHLLLPSQHLDGHHALHGPQGASCAEPYQGGGGVGGGGGAA